MSQGTFVLGTGTKDDPFIVEDILDFCAIGKGISSNTYYKIDNKVNELDFNDHPIYQNGFDNVVVVNSTYAFLDGNNKTLRNAVMNASCYSLVFTMNEINNLNFKNIIISKPKSSSGTTIGLFSSQFTKCSFGIKLNQGDLEYLTGTTGNSTTSLHYRTFNNCTLNIGGSPWNGTPYTNTTSDMGLNFISGDEGKGMIFNRCHIHFDDINTHAHNPSNSYAAVPVNGGTFKYCFFDGTINCDCSGVTHTKVGMAQRASFESCSYNVQINYLNAPNATTFSPYENNITARNAWTGVSVINKDKLGEGKLKYNQYSAATTKYFTDANMKNTKVLQDAGFYVLNKSDIGG